MQNIKSTETRQGVQVVKTRIITAKGVDLPGCLCGCNQTVNGQSFYRPGHDAKHKGVVARRVVASGNYDLLNTLPSEALRAQAREMVRKINLKKAPKEIEVKDLEIKIGRWTYPVKFEGGNLVRNTKRDGSGDWEALSDDQAEKVYEKKEGN